MALQKESSLGIWILIAGLFCYFLAYSGLVYFAIGDKGPPDWDFGTVRDVPAESPYALYDRLPHPQHVRGMRGE